MPEAQNPEQGAHLRLPAEVERLKKAAAYFGESGDEKMLALIMPQLDGAIDRAKHAVVAAEFVAKLGLTHVVEAGKYAFNDAVNVVSKVLHEHEQHESGKVEIKSLYHRSHAHLVGVNDGAHVDAEKLAAPRDSAAELIEHLGLTDPEHVSAAKALFQKVTV